MTSPPHDGSRLAAHMQRHGGLGVQGRPLPTRTGYQVRLADLDDAIPDPWLAYWQEQARKRREVAERDRMYRDGQDDDEDPLPEGPAPHASGEASRRHGGPGHWAPGRTAR